MKFKDYIELKIRRILDSQKRQGKRRDAKLLASILNVLFWERHTPNRTVYDIHSRLKRKYNNLKPDTLEDNLVDFLAKVPFDEPFVKISSESQDIDIYSLSASKEPIDSVRLNKYYKPRSIYTLNEYYLQDYFGKDVGSIAMVDAILAPTTDEDTQRLRAAGIIPCPSCGNPTHRSNFLRVYGEEKEICLTEYISALQKCIHSCKNEDGSWSEIVIGVSGIYAEGKDRDICRTRLMDMMRKWIAEKRTKGLALPSPPTPQFCLLRGKKKLEKAS